MKKTLLISGGTGFLGRNLALAFKEEYNIILGSRNNKQNFQAKEITGCTVVPMDVTNIESIRDVVNEYKPDIIIHAAATKFIDLSEKFPMECVDINILGSQNIARVAVDKNVEMVLGISTDKAAPPIRNIYGMSKAVMERIFCSMNGKTDTKFACVRYGNVAWSTGSVLPIWQERHAKTNTIGITDPEMRRFFFTVDEAVKLVKTAMENINEIQGKVLSREMKVAKMGDIAKTWIGSKGGTCEDMGHRPGERVDEFLIGEIELPFTEEKYFGDIRHFIISFNQKAEKPITELFSTANAPQMSRDEILKLINSVPVAQFQTI
jgi:UDP-N-acetylglucosamine 4,6-dehydratase